jgi:hypothetical protein
MAAKVSQLRSLNIKPGTSGFPTASVDLLVACEYPTHAAKDYAKGMEGLCLKKSRTTRSRSEWERATWERANEDLKKGVVRELKLRHSPEGAWMGVG